MPHAVATTFIAVCTAFALSYFLFARRDPLLATVLDASLFALTKATPPFVFALLYERRTTRAPLDCLYLLFEIQVLVCSSTIFEKRGRASGG